MKKLATALVSAAAIMTMSTTAFAAENPAEVFDRHFFCGTDRKNCAALRPPTIASLFNPGVFLNLSGRKRETVASESPSVYMK